MEHTAVLFIPCGCDDEITVTVSGKFVNDAWEFTRIAVSEFGNKETTVQKLSAFCRLPSIDIEAALAAALDNEATEDDEFFNQPLPF